MKLEEFVYRFVRPETEIKLWVSHPELPGEPSLMCVAPDGAETATARYLCEGTSWQAEYADRAVLYLPEIVSRAKTGSDHFVNICISRDPEPEEAPTAEDKQPGDKKPAPPESLREAILKDAMCCVCGGRDLDYGKPENSFETIANFWGDYLRAAHPKLLPVIAPNELVTPKDVAVMMALLKIARIAASDNPDSFVDLAGYAACAGELAAEGHGHD